MKLNLYSVHDVKLGVFLAPFPARNDVEAGRQIKGSLSDPQLANSPMVTNPEDFSLVKVAEFDDETGHVLNHDEDVGMYPRFISQLSAFRTGSS